MAKHRHRRRPGPAPTPPEHRRSPDAGQPATDLRTGLPGAPDPASQTIARPLAADGGTDADFEALAVRCPAPFRDEVRRPPLRSPVEVASYRARILAHAGAFAEGIPARAWSPLRDLAIAEVEADRYAAAIAGIVRHARVAALADLLLDETEAATGRRPSADDERACQALARSWSAGSREARSEVATRLAPLGLSPSVIEDLAQARSLPMTAPLERMRTNAQRAAARIRRLVEMILASERRGDAGHRTNRGRPVSPGDGRPVPEHDAGPARGERPVQARDEHAALAGGGRLEPPRESSAEPARDQRETKGVREPTQASDACQLVPQALSEASTPPWLAASPSEKATEPGPPHEPGTVP